jgi:hypothetical protein
MSDFKFPCPKCGQSILCDTINACMTIPCPACQVNLTVPPPPPAVPAAGGKLSINKVAAHSAPPPPPPGATGAPAKPSWGAKTTGVVVPKKTSGLAITSLVCSILGLSIFGIVFGHSARARIAKNSTLKGKGLATAGLVIGYLSLAASIAWFGFAVPYFKKQAEQAAAAQKAAEEQAEADRVAAEKAKARAEAAKAAWTLDLASVKFPARTASGKQHGVPFSAEAVILQNGYLTLRQTTGSSRQFVIAVPLKMGETLADKTFDVSTNESTNLPRVILNWKDDASKPPGTESFTKGYAMKLEFGATAPDGKQPGKIYLCLPDKEQSFVAGNFELGSKAPKKAGS